MPGIYLDQGEEFVPSSSSCAVAVPLIPSTHLRPLLEQVEKSLFDFLELRIQADVRASRVGFEIAFAAFQRRVANQLGHILRNTSGGVAVCRAASARREF